MSDLDYSSALSVLPGLDTALGAILQDSIMYLCMTNDQFLKITRNLLPLEFVPKPVYQKMLSLWYDYWDKFHSAPGEQIETELNWAVESKHLSKQEYSLAIEYQEKLSKMEPPNPDYVLERLGEFATQRKWFVSGVEFVKKVRAGQLEEGRSLITDCLKEGFGHKIDSGINLLDEEKVAERIIRRQTTKPYMMKWMIEPFDKAGITLGRGHYVLIAAPEKKGKSWAGIYLGRAALLQGLNILHCSQGDLYGGELEDRYDQSFTASFHWRKHPVERYKVQWFERGEKGQSRLAIARVPVGTVKDPVIVRAGVGAVKGFGGQLRIKWWPMKVCTMRMFNSFLDHLAVNENFVPDVIINDYAEIMDMKGTDIRDKTNTIHEEHRTMCGERKALVVNFSQVTQKAYNKEVITLGDFAEDKRKAAHCDFAYALCRTKKEQEKGMGRFVLFVDRHFGYEGFVIQIIQDYALGQFCKSARVMPKIKEDEK